MSDLHAAIMNLQSRDGDSLNDEFSDRRIAYKTGFKDARHAAAELAALAPVVPPGYVLVPVEPTPEMRAAFHACTDDVVLGASGSKWAAMLAAAPSVAPEPVAWLKTIYSGTTPILEVDYMRPVKKGSFPVFTAHPPRAPLTEARDQAFEAVRKQLNSLPRYSFQLNSGGGVSRVPDRYGAWIEWQAAHELFDPVAVDAALEKAAHGISAEGEKT